MTTWRDIADQLTPSQVESLEWLEGDPLGGGLLTKPKQHLDFARAWASENLEQSLHADVPPPAHAVEVGEWRKSKEGVRCRDYRSVESPIAGLDVTLEIRGSQYTDGRVDGSLGVTGEALTDLDAAAARQLAAELLAAADRLGGDAPPTTVQ